MMTGRFPGIAESFEAILAENEQLRNENERLKFVNGQLRGEVLRLNSKITGVRRLLQEAAHTPMKERGR